MKEKPFRVLTKRGNRINAAPGLGWLILVPIVALIVLFVYLPVRMLWTIKDIFNFMTK